MLLAVVQFLKLMDLHLTLCWTPVIIIIRVRTVAWFKERATRHACRLTNTVALVKALQRAKA